ncbi:hypothetical protein DAEQUDRAFT_755245 [Daedalea quercina L-15889]|uniref:PB1 domain-containing protein n=1 Tax=Daedalea quercina L-15889 TaxID=1314783 RepID=A0A165SSQ4_9APHY|nr:hypothetical protein DAEQUDRAFT_755245 [Daedalea quercina L-15889]
MSTLQLRIKLSHPNGVTRVAVFTAIPTWDDLAVHIKSYFDIPEDFVAVAYVDFDGDQVIVSSQDELREFFATLPKDNKPTTLMFTVRDMRNLCEYPLQQPVTVVSHSLSRLLAHILARMIPLSCVSAASSLLAVAAATEAGEAEVAVDLESPYAAIVMSILTALPVCLLPIFHSLLFLARLLMIMASSVRLLSFVPAASRIPSRMIMDPVNATHPATILALARVPPHQKEDASAVLADVIIVTMNISSGGLRVNVSSMPPPSTCAPGAGVTVPRVDTEVLSALSLMSCS